VAKTIEKVERLAELTIAWPELDENFAVHVRYGHRYIEDGVLQPPRVGPPHDVDEAQLVAVLGEIVGGLMKEHLDRQQLQAQLHGKHAELEARLHQAVTNGKVQARQTFALGRLSVFRDADPAHLAHFAEKAAARADNPKQAKAAREAVHREFEHAHAVPVVEPTAEPEPTN
jgi:hypothetical protein